LRFIRKITQRKAKAVKANKEKSTEEALWNSANKLRGTVESSEYKHLDDKAKYTDWSKRDDIKAELKVDLIMLLAENDYPPIDHDEVYKEIFEQAENFKKYN